MIMMMIVMGYEEQNVEEVAKFEGGQPENVLKFSSFADLMSPL